MSRQPNPDEILLTTTQLKVLYKLTDKMLDMLTPAHIYRRIGQKNPVKLYRKSDVEDLVNSETGQRLLAEAEERRRRFWEAMQRRIKLLQDELELRKGIEDKNDDLEK